MITPKYYDIGEMVDKETIKVLNILLNDDAEELKRDIWDGAFAEVHVAYLHPCDEMESTEGFQRLQDMFINAYV